MAAEGDQIGLSPELLLAREITEYGAESVMGRAMSYNEVMNLRAAKRVYQLYHAKYGSEDWAKWGNEHPRDNKFLDHVMILAREYA